jgi:hypothetical protein
MTFRFSDAASLPNLDPQNERYFALLNIPGALGLDSVAAML